MKAPSGALLMDLFLTAVFFNAVFLALTVHSGRKLKSLRQSRALSRKILGREDLHTFFRWSFLIVTLVAFALVEAMVLTQNSWADRTTKYIHLATVMSLVLASVAVVYYNGRWHPGTHGRVVRWFFLPSYLAVVATGAVLVHQAPFAPWH